ncbi:TonB-dependent receptor, partial [Thermaurantiacus sp.]
SSSSSPRSSKLGPQAVRYGRNATGGVVAVSTLGPSFEDRGELELEAGNFDLFRVAGAVTQGVVPDRLAIRIDGVWTARDGFVADPGSGEAIGNRARYLVRLQGLWTPRADLSVRIIADHARRDEGCCAALYLPPPPGDPVAGILRGLGGIIPEDPARRQASLTPGRPVRADMREWGLAAELGWTLPSASLSAISALRDWRTDIAADADFSSLDLLVRDRQVERFRSFVQEVRLDGLAGRLAWLVGAHLRHEDLRFEDAVAYGRDYTRYADALVRLADPGFPGLDALADQLGGPRLAGLGFRDAYGQDLTQAALFTQNRLQLAPGLTLLGGVRGTFERKRLKARLQGPNPLCRALAGRPEAVPACLLGDLGLEGGASLRDGDVAGSAQLLLAPRDGLQLWAGGGVGTTSGGFVLDRRVLQGEAPDLGRLARGPETARSLEGGVRLTHAALTLSLAGFRTLVDGVQAPLPEGGRLLVLNLSACRVALVPLAGDTPGRCDPGATRAAVRARGLEAEAAVRPGPDLAVALGLLHADVRFRERLVGVRGEGLPGAFARLGGTPLPLAPRWVQTGAVTWTPRLRREDVRLLFHADWRFQSAIALDLRPDQPERTQGAFTMLGARVGLLGPEARWAVEFWGRNLLDVRSAETAIDMPAQATGAGAGLAGVFPGEPRGYGVTLRSRF